MVTREQVSAAAAAVLRDVRQDPAYARTSHLRVELDGGAVVDEHLRGPRVADVFSVTKSVVATLVGVAVADGLVTDLDAPVEPLLGPSSAPPSSASWRHLLTMQRGTDELDVDAVMAQPTGWLESWRHAPRREAPGTTFRYDNGTPYVLAAALHAVTGDLAAYADARLLRPLGVREWDWLRGPEGFVHGSAHLRLSARDLARLGRLWLDGGRLDGEQVVDAGFLREMLTPSSPGGPPEDVPYGYLVWLDDGCWFAGGWAGQHLVCVPASRAVVVVTGDPEFTFGPPPSDRMPPGWRPALELVRRHLLPVLQG